MIGDLRAWTGGGGTGDVGAGGLGTVAAIDLEPSVCWFGGTVANGAVCTWVWGRHRVSALCADGTSGLAPWTPTGTEEDARVGGLVAGETLDLWLEASAACLSGAHGALTQMRQGFTSVTNPGRTLSFVTTG